ncbi:MAG TPA: SDR family oxidoreductase [Desulfosarcina sp.]|nr:SDR family oxidoreductase [Desulfosarcina sp.]
MTLRGQSVVVIGGSSGMGLAVARKASQAGARVVIASRSADKLQAAARRIGGDVHWQMVDTTDEASVADLFERLGTVDHLAVPGSSVKTGPLRELPLADARFTMQSKFWGPYLCAKHARLNDTGSITFFSGILSRRPGMNDALLASVNAAVEAMGRALAKDLAPVRVNVLSPGMTAGTGAYLKIPEAAREAMFASVAGRLPVGRVGRPEDIADAVVMLMTNGFITGVVLDVDGGGLIA